MERTAKRKSGNGKYDPSKKYQWEEQDEFTVTGAEIDAWNRAINVVVATPEFQQFLHVQRAAIAMQNFLKESVDQGVIKEAPTAPTQGMKVVQEEKVPDSKEDDKEQKEVNDGALVD